MVAYWWLLFLAVSNVFKLVSGEDPACQEAPTPAAKIICEQLHEMDTLAREEDKKQQSFAAPPGAFGSSGGFGMMQAEAVMAPEPVVTNLRECTDINCVCEMLTGKRPLALPMEPTTCTYRGKRVEKLVRKEYRMMDDYERQKFHEAINQMKRVGTYNELAKMHAEMSQAGGAHSGPAFLPWHREFVKEVELELRRIDPEIYVPYWDSALDSRLPRPQDSTIFSFELMGNGDGAVTSGPFANWRTIENVPLKRQAGAKASPMTDTDIAYVLNRSTISEMLAFPARKDGCPFRVDYNCLEYAHGNAHLWVGGHMFKPMTAANDPIFFMHHSFVDHIWEIWRLATQNREQRESEYPEDNERCSSTQHFRSSQMAPFKQYVNADGLSNKYTDKMYEYAPRPNCTNASPDCGSRFLFCDLSHGTPRCAAKIRVGGSCVGFVRDEDACYNGLCFQGVCRPAATTTSTAVTPVIPLRPPVPAPNTCWNENQCCEGWASRGECTKNPSYMRASCKASCAVCQPNPAIRDDCSDRHRTCASWSRSGECTKNPKWMSENCRLSCDRCGQTRAEACKSGQSKEMGKATTTQALLNTTTQASSNNECENSPGCFNEYPCCPLWAIQGQCHANPGFMTCNCRVSCLLCTPTDYPYGECVDYHTSCQTWKRRGECGKNAWMEENCRSSCRTCFQMSQLRAVCASAGNTGLIGPNRQRGTR